MKIRTATTDDLEMIAAVEAECFPPAEAATKEEFAKRLQYYRDHFWLMFDGEKLIAFVDGFVTDEADLTDEMYEKAKIDPSGIPKFLDSYKNDLIFRAEEPPYFLYCRKGRNKKSNTENVLDTVRRILEDLKKLT